MIRRNVRRAVLAGRRPTPQRVIDASELPCHSPAALLGVGSSLDAALTGLDLEFGPRSLLIPDRRQTGKPDPGAVHAVAARLARNGALTIGVRPEPDATEKRSWGNLANAVGAELTILGTAGWNRVVFGDRSAVLIDADVPSELHGDVPVVALSAPGGSGCLALWTEFVHPNTRLRALGATHAAVELAAAVDARYLLVGAVGSSWVAASATPAIVAELVARGAERLRERLTGYETPGPWEDAGVQHLFGLEHSGLAATELTLRARLEDNAGGELARQLSEMLGWRLVIGADQEGTGSEG